MTSYTPEQVEAAAKLLRFDDPSSGDCTHAADILDAYAATLKAAQGGVTEAHRSLLQEARDQIHSLAGGFVRADQLIARIDAALSAQQGQGQGEAVAWLHQVVAGDGEPDLALSFAADSFPLDTQLGFRSLGAVPLYTAPPAQPAERVPELKVVRPDALEIDRWRAIGWNECRNAMLDASIWFVITGTNRADTPILLFTSRALAEQFCQQNPHPDGYSIYAASPAPSPARGDGDFQSRVSTWMDQCFLPSLYSNMTERGDRLLEEVLELLQSTGYDRSRVATLVDYVWSRPVGEPSQEVGGVMVTLAGFCWIAGLNMHADGETELARINRPEVMEKIRRKQQAKNALHFDTPLPGHATTQDTRP